MCSNSNRFSKEFVLSMQRHDVEDKLVSGDDLEARFCASNRSTNEFRTPRLDLYYKVLGTW